MAVIIHLDRFSTGFLAANCFLILLYFLYPCDKTARPRPCRPVCCHYVYALNDDVTGVVCLH